MTVPMIPSPCPSSRGGEGTHLQLGANQLPSPPRGEGAGARGAHAPSLVAGLGCTTTATPADILSALDVALATVGRTRNDLRALATPDFRADHPRLREAATTLVLPLTAVPSDQLDAAAPRTLSPAPAAVRRPMTASPAEAAALAAAGPGARLLGPRMAHGPVTVALAEIAP